MCSVLVLSVIFRLAFLIEQLVTDGRTDRRAHDDRIHFAAASRARRQAVEKLRVHLRNFVRLATILLKDEWCTRQPPSGL